MIIIKKSDKINVIACLRKRGNSFKTDNILLNNSIFYELFIEVYIMYMKQDEGELVDDDLDLLSGPQSQPAELDQTIDYNFAQQELMMNEYSNDPIQEAICDLEKQYEEDKQGEMGIYTKTRI